MAYSNQDVIDHFKRRIASKRADLIAEARSAARRFNEFAEAIARGGTLPASPPSGPMFAVDVGEVRAWEEMIQALTDAR